MMDHKSYLSLGCASSYRLGSSAVPVLKPDVRQRLPFSQWLSLSYWGQGGVPSFWSRSPQCQARSGCVPSSMYAPFSSTATLATEGQEEHVLVRKKKRSKSTGWLLTEVQATSNLPSVPASAIAFPALLKHSFWAETSWSLTADHFPQPLLFLPC